MRTNSLLPAFFILFWAVPALADVVTSEFFSLPTDEGWTFLGSQGEFVAWVADGVYYEDMPNNCPPDPVCDSEAFTRSIADFNGQPTWFYEFVVSGTGNSAEIPNGAPAGLSAFNAGGNLYHCVVSSDKIKLSGDVDLPILFLDVEAGVHTIRLELFNEPPPATFHWYVDSLLVLEGLGDGPFPHFDSRIVWVGRTWMQPTLNEWYYIRAGDIPIDGSGDFDSNGVADSFEVFYFAECLDRSEAGETAHPSCSWADMNADNTVDCTDADLFAAIYTDPPGQLNFFQCNPPIPAVSQWGALITALVVLSTGAIVFRANTPRRDGRYS